MTKVKIQIFNKLSNCGIHNLYNKKYLKTTHDNLNIIIERAMKQKQVVFLILKILNECKKINYFAVCYSIKSIQL